MKYCIQDQLSQFEFHDAELSLLSFDGNTLRLSVRFLNVHKGIPENPYDTDMEIESAVMTFQGFQMHSYTRFGDNNKAILLYDDALHDRLNTEGIVILNRAATDAFLTSLREGITVLDHDISGENNQLCLEGISGIDPYFEVRFGFCHVLIAWDVFSRKAWYEQIRQYTYDLTLLTPDGERQSPVHIICDNEQEDEPVVSVGLEYAGVEYWGSGDGTTWADAFSDLQARLSDGVTFKCCLTCRHGNLCPVGNAPDEVFCTKDAAITRKSDLYFYTENPSEREKRARHACAVCGDYQPQSESYYIYTDFRSKPNTRSAK